MVDEPLAATPSGVDDDAWAAVCASVRAYCGWHVAPSVTETLTLDGSGSVFQMLPSLLVTDIDSVTEDGNLREATTYEWSASGQLWRAYPWTGHFRGMVIELTHGYEQCPADMLAVLGDLAAAADRAGVSSVTSGAHSVRYEVAMSDRQRSVLDRYRIPARP